MKSHEIFALFYAIIWGSLFNVLPRWKAFDLAAKRYDNCAVRRWFLSFAMLNVLPIVFFIIVFLCLERWELGRGVASWLLLFLIVLQGFALYGFYWLWVAAVQHWQTFYPLDWAERYKNLTVDDLDEKAAGINFKVGLAYVFAPPMLLVLLHWCVR